MLEVNPKHSNTLYNYAVLLDTHLKRLPEAESLYRRTLEMEPRHAYALYNLAVLLEDKCFNISDKYPNVTDEEIETGKQEALQLYKRAVDADPKDATTMADYARYMLMRLEDATKAEPIFVAALKLDPSCEVAMFHYGLLLHK